MIKSKKETTIEATKLFLFTQIGKYEVQRLYYEKKIKECFEKIQEINNRCISIKSPKTDTYP